MIDSELGTIKGQTDLLRKDGINDNSTRFKVDSCMISLKQSECVGS